MESNTKKLLVFNCHEAWVYQLGALEYEIDIVDGLPGRYTLKWDERIRPIPTGARLVNLEDILERRKSYDCIITHNITDLMDVKSIPGPRILVIHSTMTWKKLGNEFQVRPEELKHSLKNYIDFIGGHVVAVSRLKGISWGFVEDIVPFSADVKEYLPWSGELACGIRVANQISSKKEVLMWNFHEKTFRGIPVKIIGFNPDMPGVYPASSWDELKLFLSRHRFFIHTAHPELEDGYNMATLEAMAAGLPVIGNRHPSSPIEHGINGFLSDDSDELRGYAKLLLENHDLARKMGEKARETVLKNFSLELFVQRFKKSIEMANKKWQMRTVPDSYFSSHEEEVQKRIVYLKTRRQLTRLVSEFEKAIQLNKLEEAFHVLYMIGKDLNIHMKNKSFSIENFLYLSEIIGNTLIENEEKFLAQQLLNQTINAITNKKV